MPNPQRITIEPGWRFRNQSGQELDPLLFRVLQAVQETGKLTDAAKQVDYSYRHCWNLIKHWSGFFGVPLVVLSQGKGATLSPLGEKLAWAAQRVHARLGPQLDNLAVEIDREISKALRTHGPSLRLHASNGYAIALLPELLAEQGGIKIELQYLGSLDALASMARGNCEICGFHVPRDRMSPELLNRFSKYLKPRTHKLIHLVTRTQGLFVSSENPYRIAGLADLTQPGLRFINRQSVSGTRILFDLLLEEAGVDGSAIAGYESVEFTHAAVAAHVASGMADAGFGVEAAASRFKLAFVPLALETYYLACRCETLEQLAMRELIEALRSPRFAEMVAPLAGYDATHAGTVVSVDTALALSVRPSV